MNTIKVQAYDFLTNDDYAISKDDLIKYLFDFFNSTQCCDFVDHIKKELDIEEEELVDDNSDDNNTYGLIM